MPGGAALTGPTGSSPGIISSLRRQFRLFTGKIIGRLKLQVQRGFVE
ncbi:hypothetical protein ECL_01072 [Enterobacter cloacae subsp. cloacae ATCC 13047]|uniref:Uncharacterized protein n=1 Tax=Enterobacter cloacae subsp. cloacae (strain ATCC 13047 / DSM 30054 / NBRC 13535 / NCTC 10005 / WDCM 00083 / NCDC 279-56) TaxID=716541 RepID=A0A0H3CJA2_ENTCC|nr:hypothetical protein ECL_01072 [Enterobacter cloacae subsp. cloacae ATCC 13047]